MNEQTTETPTPRTDVQIKRQGNITCQEYPAVPARFARQLERELVAKEKELFETKHKLSIAELKNRVTLANNLCPDHRDKQAGKPCLACEIERIQSRLTQLQAVARHQNIVIVKNDEQHKAYDEYDGYTGSELAKTNGRAIADYTNLPANVRSDL